MPPRGLKKPRRQDPSALGGLGRCCCYVLVAGYVAVLVFFGARYFSGEEEPPRRRIVPLDDGSPSPFAVVATGSLSARKVVERTPAPFPTHAPPPIAPKLQPSLRGNFGQSRVASSSASPVVPAVAISAPAATAAVPQQHSSRPSVSPPEAIVAMLLGLARLPLDQLKSALDLEGADAFGLKVSMWVYP